MSYQHGADEHAGQKTPGAAGRAHSVRQRTARQHDARSRYINRTSAPSQKKVGQREIKENRSMKLVDSPRDLRLSALEA